MAHLTGRLGSEIIGHRGFRLDFQAEKERSRPPGTSDDTSYLRKAFVPSISVFMVPFFDVHDMDLVFPLSYQPSSRLDRRPLRNRVIGTAFDRRCEFSESPMAAVAE